MSSASHGFAGPYRLLNIINTGQTSQIWQAYDDAARKYFAVKMLQSEYVRNREHVNFLKWEYAVAGKIRHERLCQVYQFGWERRVPFLALEWFAAPNLKFRIRQSRQSLQPVLRQVAVQATEGVAEFCRHGWVHRDIKPDNFLVDDAGQVKLIDFGLAHRAKKGWARLFARKSKVQGTRSYMSPEQIRGKPLDDRADLYSLACTLFELFCGKPPYTGLNANDLLMQHIQAPVPWLKARNPDATCELSDLLQKAMAKDPNRRHSSVEEFLSHLRSIKMLESMVSRADHAGNAAE
ncbi:MAG: serine/threonine protein kinase [Thermoguttaceae bacterium]